MPSLVHEALLKLFRARTSLAPEILADRFSVDVPRYERAVTSEATLTQIVPTEYHADLVLLLMMEGEQPVFGVVVEAQLRADPRKLFSWPLLCNAGGIVFAERATGDADDVACSD